MAGPRRRLARSRRAGQGARGPLRRLDRRRPPEGDQDGRRRDRPRPGAELGGGAGVSAVVVTGRGVTTSVGEEVDTMFDALLAGRSGIIDGIGPCTDFDPDPVLTPKGARRTDRFSQLGIAAADKAWAESGLNEDNVDLARVGVLIG